MIFHKYPDLPVELQLQIFEEVVATRMASRPRQPISVLVFRREWKKVVERILFRNITISTPSDLADFASICGPRNGLLKRVQCNFKDWDPFRSPSQPSPRMIIIGGISELFDLLKDWRREDPNNLITLCIHASVPNAGNRYDVYSETVDLLDHLPDVPVVGRLYAQLGFFRNTLFTHDTITALHMKLPNLHGAQLVIPIASGALLQETIKETRDRIIGLQALKPGLTKLRIISNSPWNTMWLAPVGRGTQIDIAKSIAPRLSLWKNTLVSLKLDCIIDVPQLLLVAANTQWPNLGTMDLVGVVDDNVTRPRIRTDRIDACDDLLRGLVAALPGMPALNKLSALFRNSHNRRFGFSFCMDIGARKEGCVERQVWQLTERAEPQKRAITPCFLPLPADTVLAKAHGIVLPGHLVTDLQRVVWQQRQVELAVFCCAEDEPWAMDQGLFACSHWNVDKGEWDQLFMNNMDRFIYEMGQYWEWMDQDWEWKQMRPSRHSLIPFPLGTTGDLFDGADMFDSLG